MKQTLVPRLLGVMLLLVPAAFCAAQEGNATWYNTETLGLNASHASLPLGTHIRVTNLENDRQVIVTINNRMPSMPDRILDLSREAARMLDMPESGAAPVRIEVLDSPRSASTAEVDSPPLPPPELEPEASSQSPATASAQPTEPPPAPPPPPPPPPARRPASAAPPSPPASPVPAVSPAPPSPAVSPAPAVSPPPPAPPAPTASPSQSLVTARIENLPPGMDVKSIRLIININGEDHMVEIPAADSGRSVRNAPVSTEPVSAPVVSTPAARSGASPANIVPRMPDPRNGRRYRLQVGAFSSTTLAQNCFDRLKAAGFSPAFERYSNLYRVVLSGIPSAEVSLLAQRLGSAGFSEAWIREEK